MAWTAISGVGFIVLSEEVVATFPKALVWPTDVPTGVQIGQEAYEVLGVRAELTATATVGNRKIKVQVLDAADDDVVAEFVGAATTTAGNSSISEFSNLGSGSGLVGTVNFERMVGVVAFKGMKLLVTSDAAPTDVLDTLIVHIRLRR
jgi:hypothetical protein